MSVIGTPVRRREDYRFLTGQGTYTDDINRPGQLHAYILRSPHANARITGIDTSAAASAPGVVGVYTGKDMAADGVGGLPCGWQIHSKDGSPMVEPPHPPLVTDRVRHVGDQVAVVIAETLAQARDAAELIQVDYVEEPAAIDPAAALRSGAPQVHSEAPANLCYDWHLGDAGRSRGRVRQGGAGRQARPHKQPARSQRDGAARRDRRVQPGYRGIHSLHDQPEPACDPIADGRLCIAHPGGQAAGRRPRCRRRLRVEDLPLRRRGDRHLGRRQAEAAGQMDGGTLRELHVGRAWARPCHPCRARARPGCEVPRAQGLDHRQYGRLSVDLRPLHPDLSLRDAARRHLHDPGDLRRDQSRVHPHRPGRRLSRGGPPGGDLSARAHRRSRGRRARHGSGRAASAQFHREGRLPLSDAGRAAIRQRRLLCHPRIGGEGSRCSGLRGAAPRSGCARQIARPRHRHLYRGLRHRPVGCCGLARRAGGALRNPPRSASIRPAASRC